MGKARRRRQLRQRPGRTSRATIAAIIVLAIGVSGLTVWALIR